MDKERELWGIVAAGLGDEIGYAGGMPWHLPEDLRHFKSVTLGHPVIMGRSTWESLPRKPLAGRRNIVLTRNAGYAAAGAETAPGLEEALQMCAADGEIPIIIGGARIYALAMPRLTRLYVTRIDARFDNADTFLPSLTGLKLVEESPAMTSASGLSYRFQIYEGSDNK